MHHAPIFPSPSNNHDAPPRSGRRGARAARAAADDAAGGAEDAPITILMVDDDPVVVRTAARLLSAGRDIRLHTCSDAAAAEALAEELRPTVILQDVVMPRADGIAMVRAYRRNRATRDVPVLMLSSEEQPAIKADAFAAGADDYIVKFPDQVELLARIRHHARSYQRRIEREEAVTSLAERERRLEAEARVARETFGRYLSDAVVDRLLASPEARTLGGARQRVTIMMTDLRGFTALSERLPPERMVTLINIYLGVMTEIVLRHGGTIDEFIGDAILALFGAPEQRPDDAARAVACALEMQAAMAAVNAEGRAAGLPEVEMGVGLHTGDVIVGNIGSQRRAKYAVVGAAVNLAARIESYTLGGQVLISQATLDEAGPGVIVEAHLDVTPKGVAQPLRIHRVGGIQGGRGSATARPELAPRAPAREIEARFSVLEGKHAGGVEEEARVVRLGRRAVEIHARRRLPPMTNLRLRLTTPDGSVLADGLYGKVTEAGPGGTFMVHFTAVPVEVAAWLGEESGR